jgi:DNA repair exonuclease SbcCD ATPase subunit
MMNSSSETQALQAVAHLEATVAEVEQHLAALGSALKLQDASAAEQAAAELHNALSRAVDRFNQAARTPTGIPPCCAAAWRAPAARWPPSATR